MAWAPYLIPIAITLHLIEEYVLGDFLAWFRRAFPALAPGMTARWALAINAAFLIAGVLAALPGCPTIARLSVCVVLAVNGLLHAVFSITTRSYSPGLVTGLALYIPLGVWMFSAEQAAGRLTHGAAIASVLIGIALHSVPLVTLKARAR